MTSAILENNDFKARDRFVILHQELRNRICLLDYAPGTRLSETELAEEFGVSRTPLRRVLARLEDEGLVKSVQGVGTFVTDVNIDELAQTYQLRMELAEMVGKLSPKQPDAQLSAHLTELSHRAKALVQNPEPRAFAQLNMEFFLARLALTDNAPLQEVSQRLYVQTARIWLKSFFASIIDLNEEIRVFAREVDEVTAAIELGDLQAAALIQRAHISMSYSRMKR
ncbi:GntR family transcriptional regulator [Tropicibacter sp. R16_0]|uniref:GntR family transcriptional regulator n=1 Tax=Tropicibacter sp. R16_0 TaxID=2821102 RepID=UPI00336ABE54